MGIDYTASAATAKRLIGSNGTKCVLVNPDNGAGEYNAETDEYIKNEKRHDGICIVSGYKDSLIDGTVIKAGDRKVIAVLPVEPKQGLPKLEVYNKKTGKLAETYNVISSDTVNPDLSTVIVYKLHCRK